MSITIDGSAVETLVRYVLHGLQILGAGSLIFLVGCVIVYAIAGFFGGGEK